MCTIVVHFRQIIISIRKCQIAIRNLKKNSSFWQEILKNKNLLIGILACIIVAVIAVILFANLFFSNGSFGKKAAVKQYFHAIEKQNVGKIMDCVPKDYIDDLLDEYNIDKDDLERELEDQLEEEAEFEDGDLAKIEVEFRSDREGDKEDVENFQDALDSSYRFTMNFEIDKIKKEVRYRLKLRLEDENGRKLSSMTEMHEVYQYKGRWYISEALWDVCRAARNA